MNMCCPYNVYVVCQHTLTGWLRACCLLCSCSGILSSCWWDSTALHSGEAKCRVVPSQHLLPHCEARLSPTGIRSSWLPAGVPYSSCQSILPTSLSAWQSWLSASMVSCMYVSRCLLWLPLPTRFRPTTALTRPRTHTSLHMLSGLSPPSGTTFTGWRTLGGPSSPLSELSGTSGTLKLPADPCTDTQHATPQHSPTDSVPGLYATIHTKLCFETCSVAPYDGDV